ncbi:MAG: hypothetical protein RR575_07045 [Acinetobacter sp.]
MWIAVDQAGMLGAFMSAGEGDIPTNAIHSTIILLEELEEKILQFPISSLVDLKKDIPRPDDFIALSGRGFFVYDWSDIHHYSKYSNGYELISVPRTPAYLKQLPKNYLLYLQELCLKKSSFHDSNFLNINLEFDNVSHIHR